MLLYENYITKKNEQPFPVRRLYSVETPFREIIVNDYEERIKR